MNPCIVGWSHTRFGKLEDETLESLIVRVTRDALDHAGVEPRRVDAIFVSHMNGGFVPQTFVSSLPLQADPDLRFKPATRVENACASGSAALYQALDSIMAGNARIVLVVGAEKMTALPTNEAVAKALASASYTPEGADHGLTFPGIFASIGGSTSSATATRPTFSPASPPRTTRTVRATPMRTFARTWATNTVAPSRRATRSSHHRSR